MILRPLTGKSINYVFADLSETSRGDAEALGQTIEDMKQGFIKAIGQPFTMAFYDERGKCCAVIRLDPIGKMKERHFRAYFVDRAGLLKGISLPLTRFLRNITTEMTNRDKIKVEFQSRCADEKAEKWFRAMGFEQIDSGRFKTFCKG